MINTQRQAYIPERGDIVWIVLEPRVGHEQSGRRPALVLSSSLLATHTNLCVVCPITSKVIGLPFEVALEKCKTKGAVLPIHVRSVDFRTRKAVFIEKAPKATLQRVTASVQNMILEAV